ncbi:hypothetical protein L211DRAFT_856178 [Terfezia boudieri ATCC MYA-4762]|uniref:BHLH domain-containing protein n=1 Tax=Terfezia boudieri ATCC MYA-4762 TaxID=1051890 RepID=A0A3N4M1M0_9PEZI|nr:hypothetical protein L211DRAFT_856178 [Terfezia boudieri ATCC MYA-4762]
MSNEQHEMYTENVNDDPNSNQVHDNQTDNNTLPTSPQGSKRKRDDENSTIEETSQERRASLKRTNALAANSSFMAVNQSVPPTAPMAFASVTQNPGSINGTGQDPTVGLSDQLHGLGTQMSVSQPTSMNFAPDGGVRVGGPMDTGYNAISPPVPQDQQQQMIVQPTGGSMGHHGHAAPAPAPAPAPKPAVGTEEWHKVRRDNHKEVERRRRETINEGINELAKIVPGCEKNKGSILQRAVQYIQQLKENEAQNIEKWTLEKLLTEQAIAELTTSNEKLKQECERAWREAETWKKSCLAAEGRPNVENATSSS